MLFHFYDQCRHFYFLSSLVSALVEEEKIHMYFFGKYSFRHQSNTRAQHSNQFTFLSKI